MKTKNLWKGFLGKVVLAALLMGTTSCSSNAVPTEEFLNTNVGVIYSNNGAALIPEGVTLRKFTDAGNPGKWEKGNNDQWIYRIKSTDPVTKATNEVAYLFAKQVIEGKPAVILQRVVLNNQDLSGLVKDQYFNQVIAGLIQN